jgi:hypothetical protein
MSLSIFQAELKRAVSEYHALPISDLETLKCKNLKAKIERLSLAIKREETSIGRHDTHSQFGNYKGNI